MPTHTTMQEHQKDLAIKASVITDLVKPMLDESTGGLITDDAEIEKRINAEFDHTFYSQLGDGGKEVMTSLSQTLHTFLGDSAEEPSIELLASVGNAIQNIYDDSLDTTDGVINRNHLMAMTLPTMFRQIAIPDTTVIPAGKEINEIYRMVSTAGSTWGDLTEGDEIDESFAGDYSSLDQFKVAASVTDGTTTTFSVDFGHKLRKRSVMAYIDRNVVAKDLKNTKGQVAELMPQYSNSSVTMTVNYETGVVQIVLQTAASVPNDLEVAFKAGARVEDNESIIPTINHELEVYEVGTQESALATSATIMASLQMQREFGLNVNAQNLSRATQLIAAEKDRKIISIFERFALGEYVYGIKPPASGADSTVEMVRLMGQYLTTIDHDLLLRTKKSGIKTMYVDTAFIGILAYLKGNGFNQAAGWAASVQPTFAGTLFGTYRIIHAPQLDSKGGSRPMAICVGRGNDHADSAVVVGDAIPLIHIAHTKQYKRLRDENTLYESSVRDVHPYQGRQYITRLYLDLTLTGGQ